MRGPGARVIVAVSGGPDSVCLLHVLRELGILVSGVAHVNHKLRAPDSEADEEFVGGIAREMALPFHSTAAPCSGGDLEQTARRARREIFYDLIRPALADRGSGGPTTSDERS